MHSNEEEAGRLMRVSIARHGSGQLSNTHSRKFVTMVGQAGKGIQDEKNERGRRGSQNDICSVRMRGFGF